MKRRLAAILAADVVGFSSLMSRDEAGTLAALKNHRAEVFDPAVLGRGGRIVKLMGDGALAEFSSVVEAVEAAREIQRALAGDDGPLQLRIGINLGDVIVDGDDVYGDGVNVAARLEAFAAPGEICVSGAAFDTVNGKIDCAFDDCGFQSLKNIPQPVRIYRVRASAGRAAAEATAPPKQPSIAVLPFENMSGDREQEYFSDGITEDIITDLSRVSQLFVIARNSTFSYKGRAVKAQQISADLGASHLVEGSVRRVGNRVRVTVQLIDGATGGHLWAERYDRDLDDVFAVQDEISKSIVEALKVALAPNERRAIERVPTKNLQAYDRYLRGRQFLHEMTRSNLERAREMFAGAVALDPDYALALTGLVNCDAVYYTFYSSDPDFVDAAVENSRRALALAPELAEAHASMGLALSMGDDAAAADREFEAAIDLDPMLYEAYWYFGMHRLSHGDFDRAATLFAQASRVRGDDLQSKMMLMNVLQNAGRAEEMRAAARETIEIAARRLELNPDDSRAAYICAFALAHTGDNSRALEWLDIAARIDSDDPRTTYNLACAYALVGEREKAFEFLKLSIDGGRPIRMREWARIDPDFAAIRDDPRFEELMARWASRAVPAARAETR